MSRCPFTAIDRDCDRRQKEPQPHIWQEPLYAGGTRRCVKCGKRKRPLRKAVTKEA